MTAGYTFGYTFGYSDERGVALDSRSWLVTARRRADTARRISPTARYRTARRATPGKRRRDFQAARHPS